MGADGFGFSKRHAGGYGPVRLFAIQGPAEVLCGFLLIACTLVASIRSFMQVAELATTFLSAFKRTVSRAGTFLTTYGPFFVLKAVAAPSPPTVHFLFSVSNVTKNAGVSSFGVPATFQSLLPIINVYGGDELNRQPE
ncbi:MAG: hypothetical protein C0605_01270 [Hyphomicrobiales bacterium]|nr:MAG: hypothetical protein C0605_01270 [Hyphomicrobiales bacterium]